MPLLVFYRNYDLNSIDIFSLCYTLCIRIAYTRTMRKYTVIRFRQFAGVTDLKLKIKNGNISESLRKVWAAEAWRNETLKLISLGIWASQLIYFTCNFNSDLFVKLQKIVSYRLLLWIVHFFFLTSECCVSFLPAFPPHCKQPADN